MTLVTNKIDSIDRGIALFNGGKYFEAHEAWEGLWLDANSPEEKQFFQGLIMAAGSFLHYIRRECTGAYMLLEKCVPLVLRGIDAYPDLRITDFVQALEDLRGEFSRCSNHLTAESLPKIEFTAHFC
jgi:predicted metal-dependent hydrolase